MSSRPFTRDLLWNLVGFGIAGVGGLALQGLIAAHFGAATLGVFNQVFTVYIFFSQLGAFGVHFSALTHASSARDDRALAVGALIAVLPPAALAALLLAGLAVPLSTLFDSVAVATGCLYAAPGLFLFCVNKVLLGLANARGSMRLYAVLQAVRVIAMLLACVFLVWGKLPAVVLPVVLSVGELAVFLLAGCCSRHIVPARGERIEQSTLALRAWCARHWSFGRRAMWSGLLIELNSRIDVLVLAVLLDDRAVGLYSFAAILCEGLLQLLVVLRTLFNPKIARWWHEGAHDVMRTAIRETALRTYIGFGVVSVLAVGMFPLLVSVLGANEFDAAHVPFAILMLGLWLSSGIVPFSFLLLQVGLPGWHSLVTLGAVLLNLGGNLLLVPMFGVEGAAVATACSFVSAVILLRVAARRLLPVDLFS